MVAKACLFSGTRAEAKETDFKNTIYGAGGRKLGVLSSIFVTTPITVSEGY